jgi:preprotein translocase subunit Sss1
MKIKILIGLIVIGVLGFIILIIVQKANAAKQ